MPGPSVRSYNYGGGVQSTAMLVLVAQGRLPAGLFLFANVGEDSEDPATLAYVREVATPYAVAHGIELRELTRSRRDGSADSILRRLEGSAGDVIPFMLSGGNRGGRSCTVDFKLRVIGKELRRLGACEESPATVCLGISTDEYLRANETRTQGPWERVLYPLLTEVPMSRDACQALITAAGLPMPPKSACWFCPYRSPQAWAEMRRDRPELFARAVALEERKSAAAVARGRGPLTLLRSRTPLADLQAQGDELPFGDDGCDDNAGCWT